MTIVPVAGTTHDITLSSGSTKYGFMIAPGSFRSERVDDFALVLPQARTARHEKDIGTATARAVLLRV